MIHTLQWSKTEERHQLRRHFRGDPTQHRGQWAVTLGGQGLRGLTKAPVPMSTETRLCSLQDCFPSRETPDSLGLRVFTAECMSGTERDYSRRDLNVKKWPKILGKERMEGRSCALKHIHAQHNRPLPFLSVAFTNATRELSSSSVCIPSCQDPWASFPCSTWEELANTHLDFFLKPNCWPKHNIPWKQSDLKTGLLWRTQRNWGSSRLAAGGGQGALYLP